MKTTGSLAVFGLLLAALAIPLTAEPEAVAKWTNPEGKVIEAEFVELTDAHVVLRLKGQPEPIKVAHDKLSAESIEQARRLDGEKKKKEKELADATKGKFKLGEHWIPRGKKTQVMIKISSAKAEEELSKFYGKPTTQVKVTAIVPEKFDTADKDSIVVFCHASTSNGKGVSEWAIKDFEKIALEENALVLAADGEFGNPGKKDTPVFRSFLVYSVLQAMPEDYPSDQWRYIHAGHSGGCGYASYNGMYMIHGGHRVIGCFLSGGNYSPTKWDDAYKLKTSQKKQMRLFYSFGKNDPITTPALQDEMLKELKDSPYKNLRVVYHMDKHAVHQPHWKEAFQWFKEPPEK
jgi:predicted esterase